MLCIKEVEMVESVDDLKSSRSIKGTHGPDFELLDARSASALNKIIQTTRFKRNISLEEQKAQKEDRFLRRRQIAHLIYDYFRVTGANDSVENYADLPHPVPGGMLSRSFGVPSRREGPPSIWDTHGISGNVFASPTASSSAPFPQESNPWISNCADFSHHSS